MTVGVSSGRLQGLTCIGMSSLQKVKRSHRATLLIKFPLSCPVLESPRCARALESEPTRWKQLPFQSGTISPSPELCELLHLHSLPRTALSMLRAHARS